MRVDNMVYRSSQKANMKDANMVFMMFTRKDNAIQPNVCYKAGMKKMVPILYLGHHQCKISAKIKIQNIKSIFQINPGSIRLFHRRLTLPNSRLLRNI